MSTKITLIVTAVVIIAAIIAGALLWNQLPDPMASHWNEQDQVNGYMSRFWGVFLMPIACVGLMAFFLAIPQIDPLKANIEKFRTYYNAFIVLVVMFMIYIHALTLVWNMGNTNLKLTTAIFPAMGVLFIFIGLLIRKAKRNYFIGIRTPWTLSSDKVWDETHRLGGTLFAIAGVITLLGFFFPDQAFYVLMVSILVAAVIPIIYSYLVFRREEKSQS